MTEDVTLPPQTFDRLEIEALAIGMAGVHARGDPDLANVCASVLARVASTLTDAREQQLLLAMSMVYRPEARHATTPDTARIREAYGWGKTLSVTAGLEFPSIERSGR